MRAGARRKPARSVAPASPRITITGVWMPAAVTPSPTTSAVRSAIGAIEAFSAAVTARSSSPYRPVSSADVVTGRPSAAAAAATVASFVRSSGANASATAMACAPPARSRRTHALAVWASRPPVTSRNSDTVSSRWPSASSMRGTTVRRRALRRSGARPMPIIPTVATSPSSSAFTACVVEWVTSCTFSAPTSPASR